MKKNKFKYNIKILGITVVSTLSLSILPQDHLFAGYFGDLMKSEGSIIIDHTLGSISPEIAKLCKDMLSKFLS
ncbi:hypothetical protein [Pasteuria penetrans]|uniref:hypothetical protein n=1 Tax=Pasteuria penetrans TaxID=86005 RepID=UPI000FAF3BCF|nr:hypothetical protein [Pasteuria penetrans]